ncbi:flavin reductase family protein [Brevibacterium jeotgali]|uniref:Ferredoxin-NADP reductase n=1 Tax=Brevibacterium jeotgali TaxID=1262550 RepID=A0A2H1L3E9_9MICO|nr:iron-sulfur cluster-binding domain-containing protein [Brevibacterium jeotgali]TWC01692.1 ferredoxin-NADP reductase [Brevibacterium jeotgali]SMY11437.1 Ferredoxin-NADP reductase [Brevibacterium jeotgali]
MTTMYDGGVPTTEVPTGGMPATVPLRTPTPGSGSWSPGDPAALPRDAFTGDLVCTALTPITHDVLDVTFRPCEGGTLPFSPGQYFTFTFPQVGVDRCYSVSSTPSLGVEGVEEFSITVKKVPGGPVSTFLHEQFRVGDTVRADGPYGVFGSDVRPGAGALYLSAGSGVTPFLSMMRARRALLESGERSLPLWSSVVHVHAAHSPADLVHRQEVTSLSGRDETTFVPVCSQDSAAEAWSGVRGRLTASTLRVLVPDVADREVFVCGPTAYREAVLAMLVDLGVPGARIHTESYVFGETVRVPTTGDGAGGGEATTASAAVFSVEFRGAGCTVQCPQGMTILEAAREAGIAHPSSCAEGVCGTCKATKVSGEVEMDHQGGIRLREVREGRILPCCSVPVSDVVME